MSSPKTTLNEHLTDRLRRNLEGQGFDFPRAKVYDWPINDFHKPVARQYLAGKTVVFQSGGLESSVISTMFSGDRVVYVHVPDIKQRRPNMIIEPELIKLCGVAKASACVLGLEYGPLDECHGRFAGFHPNRLSEMGGHMKVTVIQPFAMTEKFHVHQTARLRGISFCSCDERGGDAWCYQCFKCFQHTTFELALHGLRYQGETIPDNYQRYLAEIEEYLLTGRDEIMTDMHSFKAALDYYMLREPMVGRRDHRITALRDMWRLDE